MSLEVVEETLLILQESQYYSLLKLVDAVPRWNVLSSWSPPRVLIRPSAIGKINSPCSWNITSFALVFSSRFPMRPSSPTPQGLRSVRHPFQIPPAYRAYPRNNPGKTFFPNWWIRDWSFAVIGWYSTNEPNGIIGPLNGCPKRLLSERRILVSNFSMTCNILCECHTVGLASACLCTSGE